MNQPQRNNKSQKTYTKFRGTVHLTMGVLYVLIGLCVIYFSKTKTLFDLSPAVSYAIAGLMIAYGIFRIYRGWQRITGRGEGW